MIYSISTCPSYFSIYFINCFDLFLLLSLIIIISVSLLLLCIYNFIKGSISALKHQFEDFSKYTTVDNEGNDYFMCGTRCIRPPSASHSRNSAHWAALGVGSCTPDPPGRAITKKNHQLRHLIAVGSKCRETKEKNCKK
jgi:hypothetical protein